MYSSESHLTVETDGGGQNVYTRNRKQQNLNNSVFLTDSTKDVYLVRTQ